MAAQPFIESPLLRAGAKVNAKGLIWAHIYSRNFLRHALRGWGGVEFLAMLGVGVEFLGLGMNSLGWG